MACHVNYFYDKTETDNENTIWFTYPWEFV